MLWNPQPDRMHVDGSSVGAKRSSSRAENPVGYALYLVRSSSSCVGGHCLRRSRRLIVAASEIFRPERPLRRSHSCCWAREDDERRASTRSPVCRALNATSERAVFARPHLPIGEDVVPNVFVESRPPSGSDEDHHSLATPAQDPGITSPASPPRRPRSLARPSGGGRGDIPGTRVARVSPTSSCGSAAASPPRPLV